MSSKIRVRFAPSPTGYLHVGGARTALFNWLYARRHGGTFVLRIEDTDAARNTEQAMQAIFDGMRWLGLDWDEGPEVGGDCGPYYQSQRGAIYERHAQKLIDTGKAYTDDAGALRFRLPRLPLTFDDLVCGHMEIDRSKSQSRDGSPEADMTIRRADGGWIFHFVNVVDDIEMAITHVVRGEDHLSNTPKHIELFAALGAPPPAYAHIPLILNKDGSKMSKRDQGAAVGSYIDGGYAPEAVVNYIALLGWSPKDDSEKLSIEELTARFDFAGVNRKGAHFDLEKCNWLNAQYLMHMPMERYVALARPWIAKAGITADDAALTPVLALVKEKAKFLTELPEWIGFFFTEDYPFLPDAEEKLRKPGALDRLAQLADAYREIAAWDAAALEAKLKELATTHAVKAAEFVHPARTAVSGKTVGPSLYHMLEVLGRERVLSRMARAQSTFAP
ncbi:MAG: glutamate--tRNA ligase family protein [Chthoniobacteraceae bacterium]